MRQQVEYSPHSLSLPLRRSCNHTSGFSLVELLVVLAIGLTLAALSVGSLSGLVTANSLSGAASVVGGQIDLARQTAQTLNHAVQLRFYIDTTLIPNGVHVVQIVTPSDTSAPDVAVQKECIFPQQIVLADSATTLAIVSSISSQGGPVNNLGSVNPINNSGASQIATSANNPPVGYSGAGYYSLTFNPNGSVSGSNGNGNSSTSPANGTDWTLALISKQRSQSGVAPKNWVLFSINSLTGYYTLIRG